MHLLKLTYCQLDAKFPKTVQDPSAHDLIQISELRMTGYTKENTKKILKGFL